MKINLSLYLFLIMEMLVEATEKNRELNLNFLQDDYQLKFERLELVRYNKQLFKDFSVVTFKYNRTTAAVNATFTVKYDVGRDIEAIVQAYKFMSNEYRSFPIHFAANAYKALDANVAGTRGFFNCGNYTGFPFIKERQNKPYAGFICCECSLSRALLKIHGPEVAANGFEANEGECVSSVFGKLVKIKEFYDPRKEIYGSRSLKGVRLTVPRAVRAGHSVTLGCDYDLEDAPLYSVKWYRGTDEFYRYVPKEEPPTRVFPQAGLHVDVSVSNARKVTLLSVGRPLSGVFQCEVSADAPLFHTEIRASPMTVVVVPDGAPVVSVDRGGLERGGPLLADCTAPPASPAPNLTWYVNDQRVPGSTSTSVKVDEDLLETATSRLELTGVGGSWGTIRLRCEATVFRLYKANSLELEVRPDSPTPQPASVLLMGPSLNGKPYLLSSRPFLYTSVSLVLLRWRCQTAS